ncbi:hypothetical protein D3C71_1663790 [compost metagenome]
MVCSVAPYRLLRVHLLVILQRQGEHSRVHCKQLAVHLQENWLQQAVLSAELYRQHPVHLAGIYLLREAPLLGRWSG